MDFSYMAYQFYNFLLTFFNLLNEEKENYVPVKRPLLPEDFNAAIEKAISPLIIRLEESDARIQKLENKETVQVVFSAAVGHGNLHFPDTPYNTDKPLIFKKVITNIGEAYKTDTGHFVAPFAGIYYFVFFHHAGGKYGTNLYLYKREERIVQAQNHKLAFEKAFNGGNAVFLKLKAGDYVYIRMEKETHVWASDTHTTFSGFLVEKTEDEKADSQS